MATSGSAGAAAALDGVFGVNKPMGLSSAQVIRDCQHHFNPSTFFKPMIDQQISDRAKESNNRKKRRGFGKNDIRVKMGHGGTLDPLATGVLILGVGKGTKSLQSFLDCTKTYETTVVFGASTDTYDRVGKILKKTAYDHITRPMVEQALDSFRGKYQQMPPLYSALKMEGKPLYEYAREGKPIPREIATREVQVTDLELVEWYEPGTHAHRWPAEEATSFERGFAEEVWKAEKQQMDSKKKKLSPEEEEAENKARRDHESFKRKADESVDALVYDRVNKRKKAAPDVPMMSGALGQMPPAAPRPGKGSDLVAPAPDPDTPPPWDDKGPPAAKLRMTVTSGFYVRSFCHDLGSKVGSSALMAELCRSRQGDFLLGSANCLEYSDLAKGEDAWAPQLRDMLAQWNDQDHTRDASRPPTRAKQHVSPKSKTLPTPNASSPSRDSAEKNAQTTRDVAAKEEKDLKADLAPPVTPAASQETSGLGPTDKDTDEASWNGFSDAPVSGKQ
ncbi:trub family pseudouridylate synthase-containing protein [Xylariaceae sp. FL0804]|nr:trub family pseudouridylate synthase-containing protein [Xylariaceae sp. FL0804]